jgi:hypothetical protein
MHYEKSQAIFRAGDPADAVFRVMAPSPMGYDSSHISEGDFAASWPAFA